MWKRCLWRREVYLSKGTCFSTISFSFAKECALAPSWRPCGLLRLQTINDSCKSISWSLRPIGFYPDTVEEGDPLLSPSTFDLKVRVANRFREVCETKTHSCEVCDVPVVCMGQKSLHEKNGSTGKDTTSSHIHQRVSGQYRLSADSSRQQIFPCKGDDFCFIA